MKEITVSRGEADIRLDKFLEKLLPGVGRPFLYKTLRKKNITLNGKKAAGSERLREGDVIRIFFADETFALFCRKDGEERGKDRTDKRAAGEKKARELFRQICIVYEDADILIADKPAGLLTQKAAPDDFCLNDWLCDYVRERKEAGETVLPYKPSAVNRLDRNTSGMVLCAKSYQGARALSAVLRDRSLHKYYLALVKGRIREPGTLSGYLVKDSASNRVTVSADCRAGCDGAVRTEYEPVFYRERQDMTLLRVCLITGKPHQIRAHLASIGHPIAGDPKYGDLSFNRALRKSYGTKRQLLHACEVTFPTEDENAAMRGMAVAGRTISCSLPPDFESVLEKQIRENV